MAEEEEGEGRVQIAEWRGSFLLDIYAHADNVIEQIRIGRREVDRRFV